MHVEFLKRPVYGQQAAETWKDLTGNYPVLPPTLSNGEGAVIMNSGRQGTHCIGFFGFNGMQDQVLLFQSYFEAEEFFRHAKENPRAYGALKSKATQAKVTQGEPEKESVEKPAGRPRHLYEGSGDREE